MTTETTTPKSKKKKGLRRSFNGRTEDMFTITGTFCQSFISLEAIISAERPRWKAPFFSTLKTKHNNLNNQILGTDTKGPLKNLSHIVRTKFDDAKDLLGDLQAQMEYGFLKEPETLKMMLDKFGYTEHWPRAIKGNQVAMTSLLSRFTENIAEHRESLIAIDVLPAWLTELADLKEGLNAGNLAQESTKFIAKMSTNERTERSNEIYLEIMAIAKIVNRILKKRAKLAKTKAPELFNYALALRNLHTQRKP